MSISTTSHLAYKEINSDGTAVSQKNKILNILDLIAEPMSAREIKEYTGLEINAVSGRINDLKKEGLVVEGEKRRCTVSNKMVTPVCCLTKRFTFNTRFLGKDYWKASGDEVRK